MGTRIQRFCDNHERTDVPASPRGPFWGRMVDLCDECNDELTGPLGLLVDAVGVAVEGAPVKRKLGRPPKVDQASLLGVEAADAEGVFPCLVCHAPHTAGGMGAHLKRMHGGANLRDVYGSDCPICGKSSGNAGTHVGRTHPEANGFGTVGAFEWARAAGDPFGVVARQSALAAQRAA
jgi:hypothetical protein